MADRMRRLWMPFRSSIAPLAGSADARVDIKTFIESAQARNVQQFTITRMIIGMNFSSDTGPSSMIAGVRFENENVGAGTVSPITDATAEWLYWEEFMTEIGAISGRFRNFRDIGTQRKSRGNDNNLFLYVSNTTAIAGDFQVSGRVLALIP